MGKETLDETCDRGFVKITLQKIPRGLIMKVIGCNLEGKPIREEVIFNEKELKGINPSSAGYRLGCLLYNERGVRTTISRDVHTLPNGKISPKEIGLLQDFDRGLQEAIEQNQEEDYLFE